MRTFGALGYILQLRVGCIQRGLRKEAFALNSRSYCTNNLPTLTMFTKDNCSLCDDARLVLERYKNRYNFEEVYITEKGNEEWFKKYRYEIPVFHFNGSFLMKHRVNEELLEQALTKHDTNS